MLGGPKGEGRAGGPTLQRAQAFVLIQFSFGGPAFLVKFRSIPCFPPDYTNYAVGSILFYVLCGSLAGPSPRADLPPYCRQFRYPLLRRPPSGASLKTWERRSATDTCYPRGWDA